MNHHPRSENGQVNTDHLTTRLLPTEDPDDLVLGPLESVLYTRNKTRSFTEWLNPPHYPRAVQLFRTENLAVPASYLVVGILQGLSGPLMNVYPLDIGATEAQQTTILMLRNLPATFKILFGFWSDNYKLFGYRRKSYMALGWMVSTASMIVLLLQKGDPSIPILSAMYFLFGVGFWFADVMADSIVAEKAKLEPEETRGDLQSTCYACRFFGLMIAAPISTFMYSSLGPRYVITWMAILPCTILPLVYLFEEIFNVTVKSPREQCHEIWTTVCSRAVWQPLGFVYIYNIFQVYNAAWREYLRSVLHFSSNQLNVFVIVSNVLLYVGVMSYKYYFIKWSWRTVYIYTTSLNGLLSFLQILLIKEITFGLSPFLFALGDDAFADVIHSIHILPTTIMMVHLCPSGSEGASYAMFTTVSNSAFHVAGSISTQLLRIWDVSKETMVNGDLGGFLNLTILTSVCQTLAIVFVGLLPKTRDDLVKLNETGGSKIGGAIFLTVVFVSILYTLVASLLNIIMPGWSGES